MPTPFKKVESEITRMIIDAASVKTFAEREVLNQQIHEKFNEMIRFPSEQMTEQDHAMLRKLEDRLASEDFIEKIKTKRRKADAPPLSGSIATPGEKMENGG